MKKIFLSLLLIISVFTLSGCGEKKEENNNSNTQVNSNEGNKQEEQKNEEYEVIFPNGNNEIKLVSSNDGYYKFENTVTNAYNFLIHNNSKDNKTFDIYLTNVINTFDDDFTISTSWGALPKKDGIIKSTVQIGTGSQESLSLEVPEKIECDDAFYNCKDRTFSANIKIVESHEENIKLVYECGGFDSNSKIEKYFDKKDDIVKYNESLKLPTLKGTLVNKIFKGWYKISNQFEENFEDYRVDDNTKWTSSQTIYAIFETPTYKITPEGQNLCIMNNYNKSICISNNYWESVIGNKTEKNKQNAEIVAKKLNSDIENAFGYSFGAKVNDDSSYVKSEFGLYIYRNKIDFSSEYGGQCYGDENGINDIACYHGDKVKSLTVEFF